MKKTPEQVREARRAEMRNQLDIALKELAVLEEERAAIYGLIRSYEILLSQELEAAARKAQWSTPAEGAALGVEVQR